MIVRIVAYLPGKRVGITKVDDGVGGTSVNCKPVRRSDRALVANDRGYIHTYMHVSVTCSLHASKQYIHARQISPSLQTVPIVRAWHGVLYRVQATWRFVG
jgi:hypothetical protein